jgi:hypothetical protein
MRRVRAGGHCVWLLGLLASDAIAAELPRVFFTPAERATISTHRAAGRPLGEPAAPPATSATAAGAPRSDAPAPVAVAAGTPSLASRRRIDGITVGRAAQPVAWIGGQRVADGASWGEYRVRVERDGVRLIGADGSVRRLRVGMELPP